MDAMNNQLQAIADNYTGQDMYAGIGWRVEKAGKVIASGTSGTSDEARKTPLQDDALYRIYSMTKPVVSVMALILVQRGQLRLSDFLMQYIPAFATTQVLCDRGSEAPLRPITIEDLLTHRSGLSYDFVPNCPVAAQYAEIDLIKRTEQSLEEFANTIAEFPLAFQPGTQWRYSVATDVLARVLEVASGQSLDTLLEETLFGPLGMSDTGFYVPLEKQLRLVPLYGFETIDLTPAELPPHELILLDAEPFYPSRPDHNALRGGLGLFSTSADYCKFATMLLTGKTADGKALLSPAMNRLMVANRIPESQMPLDIGPMVFPGYGFCLIGRVMHDLGRAMSLTNPGEFGWEGAAGTYFWVDREEQMVGVVMSQFLATYLPMRDDMRGAVYATLGD